MALARDEDTTEARLARQRELIGLGLPPAQLIHVGYESSPFGMSITSAQPENLGTYVAANPAYCAITGYSVAQLCGMTFQTTSHPDHRLAALECARELLKGTKTSVDATTRLLRADGSIVWVRQHRSLVRDESGKPLNFFTHTENLSEQKAHDAALFEAQGRFRSAFDNAPIGMTISNATLNGADRYIEVNRAFCVMTGYTSEQLLERSFLDITHPDDRTANSDLWRSLLAGDIRNYQLEKRYIRNNGEIVWVLVNTSLSHDADGRPLHKITQIVDISERKRYEVQLQHFAQYDSLTGLHNRRHFEGELEQQITLGRQSGTKVAVALIDIDNFKYVNDTFGHAAGDEVLCRIGNVLTAHCRPTDILARLGGDEFAIILRDVGAAQANRIANEMRTAICEDTALDAMKSVHVSASIGVAFVDVGQFASAQDVLVAADVAMYDAKKAGRNRVSLTLSVSEPRAQMQACFTWVERIREALLDERFVLLGQPVTRLASGTVDRHQLLLRMVGDDGESIAPTEFLPTAERFDLVQQIDKWVLRHAIAALRDTDRRGRRTRLAVAVSAKSIADADVLAFIERELLQGPRLAPRSLIIGITGSSAIANVEATRVVADRLRGLGCSFSLDDFCSGPNSFALLKRLDFETVKIDAAFIERIGENVSDRQMVEGMVQMVTCLGKETLADGVENQQSLDILRAAGADFAQGNHIGSPRPLAELCLEDAVARP